MTPELKQAIERLKKDCLAIPFPDVQDRTTVSKQDLEMVITAASLKATDADAWRDCKVEPPPLAMRILVRYGTGVIVTQSCYSDRPDFTHWMPLPNQPQVTT